MRWINSEDQLPRHGTSILVEYRSGSYVKMEFNGSVPKDWWERNILRWLDESVSPNNTYNTMPDEINQLETMQIQTLSYAGEEWMRVTDIIEWIKINGDRHLIPFTSAHLLIKSLVRLKNTKPQP